MPKKKAAKKSVEKKASRAKNAKTAPLTRGKKTAAKPAAAADFAAAFAGLKSAMAGIAGELLVTANEPKKYYLVTKSKSWKGGPMFFGAVMMGKAYVSYHLMPLYTHPELAKAVSPELKKRMQGKSCFNFREPDLALFTQLGELAKAGLEKYREKKWL